MSKPLDKETKTKKYFKEYILKLVASKKVTTVTLEEAVLCFSLAHNKVKLEEYERDLLKPPPPVSVSKNDISRDELAARYEKLIICLNQFAQWDDSEVTDSCDCPWVAARSRRILTELGEVEKNIREIVNNSKTIKINVDSN